MTDRETDASRLDEGRRNEGQRIVRWHAGLAAGASAIPLPFADMAGVMAVQVAMVRRLARLHGAEMERMQARALLVGAIGGAVSPSVTALGFPSMMKVVPGIGTFLGGLVAPAAAAAATMAVGDAFIRRFADEAAASVQMAPAATKVLAAPEASETAVATVPPLERAEPTQPAASMTAVPVAAVDTAPRPEDAQRLDAADAPAAVTVLEAAAGVPAPVKKRPQATRKAGAPPMVKAAPPDVVQPEVTAQKAAGAKPVTPTAAGAGRNGPSRTGPRPGKGRKA